MIDEKQQLIVSSYGSVYLMFVIDWNSEQSYFVVSNPRKSMCCNTLKEAKVAFDKMCKEEE